jgi:hypothetical protein
MLAQEGGEVTAEVVGAHRTGVLNASMACLVSVVASDTRSVHAEIVHAGIQSVRVALTHEGVLSRLER